MECCNVLYYPDLKKLCWPLIRRLLFNARPYKALKVLR